MGPEFCPALISLLINNSLKASSHNNYPLCQKHTTKKLMLQPANTSSQVRPSFSILKQIMLYKTNGEYINVNIKHSKFELASTFLIYIVYATNSNYDRIANYLYKHDRWTKNLIEILDQWRSRISSFILSLKG